MDAARPETPPMSPRKPRSTTAPPPAGRKKDLALADLEKAARCLADQLGRLEGFAHEMKKHRVTHIRIDGQGLLTRGTDEIDRFLDNVGKGISQAKRDRERQSLR